MINKNDIKPGSVFINIAYNMSMAIKFFEPGHESHLGFISLRSGHFTWIGSFRDFLSEFKSS